MAGLYALAAAFFASLSVVYVLVCTFTPFLGCGYLINARLPPSLAFCIIYYNYTTGRARGGGNVAARVEGRDRAAIRTHARAAESRSPRAPGPRPACPGRPPRAALAEDAAPGSLLRQHFLHYFSVEIPRGERGIRTAENTPSTHLGAYLQGGYHPSSSSFTA